MFRFILSNHAKKVYDKLKNPELWDFEDSSYTISLKDGDYIMWVANGSWFFDGYNKYKNTIGLFDRHILWAKYCKMKNTHKKQYIEKLYKDL